MFRRFLSLPLLAVLFTLLVPTAGQAAADPVGSYSSGGGCRSTADVGACVSYSSTYKRVSGDFYLNTNYRGSCYANFRMYVGGTWYDKYTVFLDHRGRYPEEHVSVDRPGSGYTVVHLYDCDGNYQYSATSPTISYP